MNIDKKQILDLLYETSTQENSNSNYLIIGEDDFDYLAYEIIEKFKVIHSREKLGDCVIHSTDFNGKCFNCGKQVFVKEEIQ